MSELRQTVQAFQRQWVFVLLFTVLVAGIGLVVATSTRPKYQTSVSFSIALTQKQQTPDYQYDGYYAIKAAELVSQTLISWFLTPSVILDIYSDAGVPPNISNLNRFVARFKARQHAAQNIVITFKEDDETKARAIAESIVTVVEKKGEALNTTEQREALFDVQGSTPVIVKTRLNPYLTVGSAMLFGFFIALFAVSVKEYWNEGRA